MKRSLIAHMVFARPSAFDHIFNCARWLVGVCGFLCRLSIIAWGALALYFSIVPWQWLRVLLPFLPLLTFKYPVAALVTMLFKKLSGL